MFLRLLHHLWLEADTRSPPVRVFNQEAGLKEAVFPSITEPSVSRQSKREEKIMKRITGGATREEVLFREIKKALPYMERGIDWSDLKDHRREIRIDRAMGR